MEKNENQKNQLIYKFDKVRNKYKIKFKDTLFKEEIESFKKYSIIDENNMFNYIYLNEFYKYMIESPIEYKINIITKNKDQISNFAYNLLNSTLSFEYNRIYVFYETYLDFLDKKGEKFNLYSNDLNSYNNHKIILNNKTLIEIDNYLISLNEENEQEKMFVITNSDFKFNYYPSVQFRFCYNKDFINIDCIKRILINDKNYSNQFLIELEKNILEQYFCNKKTLYLNEKLSQRDSTIMNSINLILYDELEWNQNNSSLIEKLKFKLLSGYKDVIINNIIINYNNKELYYSERYAQLIDKKIEFCLTKNIFEELYNHFKTEMNYFKTSLININSLINDHMKLTFKDNISLKNNQGEYLTNSINKLVESEIEDYKIEKKKVYENIIIYTKKEINQKLSSLKNEIDNKYFISNSSFNYLYESITQIMKDYETKLFNFFKLIDNLNIQIFYSLKRILNEQGIFSINFDGMIKIVAVERIKIQAPIENIMKNQGNSFANILSSFGLSGIVGGTASFLAGRIGTGVAAGTFGGPIGIGIGLVVGIGTFVGQTGYHFSKNRKTINSVYNDMEKSIQYTLNIVEDSIKKEIEKVDLSIEKDINEVKQFINILLDRVVKISIE